MEGCIRLPDKLLDKQLDKPPDMASAKTTVQYKGYKRTNTMHERKITGHSLTPGKTIRDYIHVAGTVIQIPYVVICGTEPGPTVLITAGIHNAEYVGIQAAIELSNELDASELRGNVIIVPLVNRTGFENRTMSMVFEDGKNLNRVFPGSPSGSVADRIAYTLFEGLIRNVDAYIDLHGGDGYETLTPFAYYVGDTSAENAAKCMVSCVNVRFCVRSRCRNGGAYNMASVIGVPSVLIERGQLGLYSREEVDADKADVRNILCCLGVTPGDYILYPKQELLEYDVVAPNTGCWYPGKKAGDSFRKGDTLGIIRDYFGSAVFTQYAPCDGILLYQCSSLNILENGPMIAYGVPTSVKE